MPLMGCLRGLHRQRFPRLVALSLLNGQCRGDPYREAERAEPGTQILTRSFT